MDRPSSISLEGMPAFKTIGLSNLKADKKKFTIIIYFLNPKDHLSLTCRYQCVKSTSLYHVVSGYSTSVSPFFTTCRDNAQSICYLLCVIL